MLVGKNKISHSFYLLRLLGTFLVFNSVATQGKNIFSQSILFESFTNQAKRDSSTTSKIFSGSGRKELLLSLTGPTVTDTTVDAHCYGVSDGKISYVIAGSNPPFSFSWNTGTSGKIIGSCWNVVTINNPGSSLSNFQVKVNLNYQSGMTKDFSDIRFSDTTNTTLYNYWIEDKTDSVSAVVWVKIPSIPAGTSYMNVSYCNSALSTASNGYNTFEFFDNFDDGDISDWTTTCQNVNETDETCSVTLDNGTYKSAGYGLKMDAYAHCGGPTTDGVTMGLQKSITLPSGKYSTDVSSKMFACLHTNCSDSMQALTDVSYAGNFPGYWLQINQKGSCGCVITPWIEENWPTFTSTGASAILRLEGTITDCGSGTVWKDNVRIRKAADQPPTTSVGSRKFLKLTNLLAGNYTINVTDANSVSGTQTITVDQPALPSAVSGSRCDTGSVVLGATGAYASFKWYQNSSGGSVLSTGSSFNTNLNNTSTFYVSGLGDNNCESTPRVAITGTINPLPSSPAVINSSICGPGSVTLKAKGSPLSYEWYATSSGGSVLSSDSSFSTTINSDSTFYVSAVDLLGCKSKRVAVLGTIDPVPQGFLTGADTVKQGGNSDTLRVSGITGAVKNWEVTIDASFSSFTTIPLADTFYSKSALMHATYFRAVIESGSCPDYYTNIIKVNVNIPHICNPDTAFAFKNDTLVSKESVLRNDIDSTSDLLNVITGKILTANGGIINYHSDGNYTYVPPLNFVGRDSVQYTACDLYDPAVSYCRSSVLHIIVQDTFFLHGNIIVYHGFSPNGDMYNDSWVIDGIDKYPHNRVIVFDRWGNLVFEREGYDNTEEKVWKGKANRGFIMGDKDLPDGTYFYRIELGGGYRAKTGYVVIKR